MKNKVPKFEEFVNEATLKTFGGGSTQVIGDHITIGVWADNPGMGYGDVSNKLRLTIGSINKESNEMVSVDDIKLDKPSTEVAADIAKELKGAVEKLDKEIEKIFKKHLGKYKKR